MKTTNSQNGLALAATLLSFVPTIVNAGAAHVVNNCGTKVYYASTYSDNNAAMQELPARGFTQAYIDGVGISIKLSPDGSTSSVAQFEFTLTPGQGVYYDISNINGNPFQQGGTNLVPSIQNDPDFPTCVTVNCPAGAGTCTEAYNLPNDLATKVCPDTVDLTFNLCPGGGGGGNAQNNVADAGVKSSTAAANSGGKSTPAAAPVNTPAASTKAPAPSASATATGRSHRGGHKRRGHVHDFD